MIGSVVASPAAISPGIWHSRRIVSFPSEFTSGSPSASRKFFPSTSIFCPIEKDVFRTSRALELHVLCREVAVDPRTVTTKVESQPNTKTQNLKEAEALSSAFEDVFISVPVASSNAKTSKQEKNPKRLSSSAAEKTSYLPVIRYPLGTESAIKAILEHNTLVFVVDKSADKNMIKDDVKRMFKIRAKKVNTSITPDGNKKAYIMLAPGFNAVDVAKKIKIL